MIIDDVHRGIHKHKARKRIGRGPGSGHGKTSGRGHKGQGSRRGSAKKRTLFAGGQTVIFRRIAKRGFNNNAFAADVFAINISALNDRFENGDVVSPETLKERGIVKASYDVLKILGNGELSKKLTVKAHKFSSSAEEKIKAAGGTVEAIA
jgi:large subunit ribosomal protein L15